MLKENELSNGISAADETFVQVTDAPSQASRAASNCVLRREVAGEFIGTWLLITFGCGVNAQVTLSGQTAGSFLSINLAWGLAVTMAVYLTGQISGAHLNPALTIALAVFGKLPSRKVLPYIGAQMAGAFLGAATVYLAYHEAIGNFDGGIRQVLGAQATAGIFATYPQGYLSAFPGGFIDQVLGTMLLTLLIFSLTDGRNSIPKSGLGPVVVGAVVLLIGMSFGYNAGYAINPARDLGPRLLTFVGGWGSEVFTAAGYWFWVPIVAPCVGAILGGALYTFALQRHVVETCASET